MSVYGNYLNNNNDIPSIDLGVLIELNELGADLENIDSLDESFMQSKVIDDIKKKQINLQDLKNQWKKVADKFTMHKWIYRYIKDDKQEEMLHKYYDILCDDNVSYGEYKKAYKFFCNFFGIPSKGTVIEWFTFDTDKQDKGQKKIAIRYSRGIAKVNIPEGMRLLHTSPAKNIKELIPTFKSKTKGKFFYPQKRVYFTVDKDINPFRYGLGNQKSKLAKYTVANKVISSKETSELSKYTPSTEIQTAYIDPTYAIFKERSVYVDTEKPISVKPYVKKEK